MNGRISSGFRALRCAAAGWRFSVRELLALSQLSAQAISAGPGLLRVLVVKSAGEPPPPVRELAASRPVQVTTVRTVREARDPSRLSEADAVLICGSMPAWPDGDRELLADALISHHVLGIVLSPEPATTAGDDSPIVHLPPGTTADELWGRLATIRQCQPMFHALELQVSSMQRLGKRLNQQFVAVDQELRLASRLQRNFLPQSFPEIGDIRFAALYRPASWVSGDDYDVRRLDESHLSFFLADAVGHGVAAGLLTMFIRQSMVGKHVQGDGYRIIPPGEVLGALNRDLAAQELPNCQFVTACYGMIDAATNQITFARGGHPHPIHVTADGVCHEVRTVGGLLGVFPGEEFSSISLSLEPAEKLILYSDGLEDAIVSRRKRDCGEVQFTAEFLTSACLPARACLGALADVLDGGEGSIQPADDQTCLIIERVAGRG